MSLLIILYPIPPHLNHFTLQGVDWFKSLAVDEGIDKTGGVATARGQKDSSMHSQIERRKSVKSILNSFDGGPWSKPGNWIVDKHEHATLAEQSAAFLAEAEAICLADNWVLSNRTSLYSRKEEWTSTPTMMDKAVIGGRPAAIAVHLYEEESNEEQKTLFDEHAGTIVTDKIKSRGRTTSATLAVFIDSTACRYDLSYRRMPLPWPLSDRDILFLTGMRVYEEGTKEEKFASYALSIEASEVPKLPSVVRIQGVEAAYFCALAEESDSSSIFYYTLNMNFGGMVPAHISNFAICTIVRFPQNLRVSFEEKDKEMQRSATSRGQWRSSTETSAASSREVELQREVKHLRKRLSAAKVTGVLGIANGTDLTLQACLVAEFKDKTIKEQRTFFRQEMRRMARSTGGDWTFYGRTKAKDVADSRQVDVYARGGVSWSKSKQLRATVEINSTPADVFQHFMDTLENKYNAIEKGAATEFQSEAMASPVNIIPVVREAGSATSVIIREIHMVCILEDLGKPQRSRNSSHATPITALAPDAARPHSRSGLPPP